MMYIYVCLCTERERERERETYNNKKYIYLYVCVSCMRAIYVPISEQKSRVILKPGTAQERRNDDFCK